MPSPNVDIVFVLDASGSMKPCFNQLREHLKVILKPLQGTVSKVRYGLVAQYASGNSYQQVYFHQFLNGSNLSCLQGLYSRSPNDPDPRNEYFTDDPDKLISALSSIVPQGDEEMLVALDVAADFPFGPASNTKRVIALFSDEPFEGGVTKGGFNDVIPKIIKKIMDRRIQLFVAIPDSPAIQQIAETDKSEVELVSGAAGLQDVDFNKLLSQMGKSISASSMQYTTEPSYERALFGQDKWFEVNAQIGNDSR